MDNDKTAYGLPWPFEQIVRFVLDSDGILLSRFVFGAIVLLALDVAQAAVRPLF